MRAVATAIALTASLAVGVPAPVEGSSSGHLVFASPRRGNFEIFRVDAQGAAAAVNLSRNGVQNLDPAWSPDGAGIVFARTRPGQRAAHLFVMDAEGGNVRQVTSGPLTDREPAWSPDGTRIAFVRSAPPLGTSRIFTVRVDGSNLRRLTNTAGGVTNTGPSWSPDGARLAFASDRSGSMRLYTMRADGSGVTRLVAGDAVDVSPAWSPDGTRIVFERCCPRGVSDLWVVGADGKGLRNLTRSDVHEAAPTWSPDGTGIAFVRFPVAGGDRSIWTMDADGGDRRRITAGRRADLSPDWGRAAQPPMGAVEGTTAGEPVHADAGPGPAAVAAAGPGRISQRVRRVAPGVRMIRRVHRRGPKRVFALEVDLGRRRVDVGLGGGRLLGVERTSRIARRLGALAAVNGDFSLPGGRPAHTYAQDGDLKQSSFQTGPSFAVVRGGRRVYMRSPQTSITIQEPSGDRWLLGRWNAGAPVHAESGVYSPAAAGLETSPRGACAARLAPAGPRRWSPGQQGLERDHVVRRVGCYAGSLARNGKTVVAARPGSPEALLIRSLPRGSTVSLGWSLGFPRAMDSLGGYPSLVSGGRVVAKPCAESICFRHPRTAVAVKGNGRLLLVVVDGRRRGWSVGMSLVELARELRRMGARRAMNLDGGGSSTLVLRGRVVNRPSDGSERRVSSALAVLRGGDRGEVEPLPEEGQTGMVATSRSEPWLLDPGSTGGFLEAVAAGAFGPPRPLPPELREVLRAFRAA